MEDLPFILALFVVGGGAVWFVMGLERRLLKKQVREAEALLRRLAASHGGRHRAARRDTDAGRTQLRVAGCPVTATYEIVFHPAQSSPQRNASATKTPVLSVDLRDVLADAVDPRRFADLLKEHGGTSGPDEHDLKPTRLHRPSVELRMLARPPLKEQLRRGRLDHQLQIETTRRGLRIKGPGAIPFEEMITQVGWLIDMYRLAVEEAVRPDRRLYR